MSTILITGQTTPPAPSAGKLRFYVDSSDNILKSIDSSSVVVNYNVTNETIQDVLGSTMTDSATIEWTYNDIANTMVADLVPGGISHTILSNIGTNTHAQIDTHIANTSNPHSVTATQVGLGNVDNTSDATKNTATATLSNKTISSTDNTISLAGGVVDGGSPIVGDVLKYNGVNWVPGAGASSSAGSGITFYDSTPVIINSGAGNIHTLITLSKTPVVTTEQTVSGTGDSASTAIPFVSSLYNVVLNRTTIDAGDWSFSAWLGVNNTTGTTTFTKAIYKVLTESGTVTVTGTGTSRTATASLDAPFDVAKIDPSATSTVASYLQTPSGMYQITARTSDTVVTIATPTGYVNESAVAFNVWKLLFVCDATPDISTVSPVYSEYIIDTTQPAFTVTTSHKLGSIGFVSSTASRTITQTYDGNSRQAHFSTPLSTLHNDIVGLQGGTSNEFYHLTSTEYTGTGSGAFVRQNGPTFTGQVKFPDGSAAAPSITFSNDTGPNLGFYRVSEDIMSIVCNGVVLATIGITSSTFGGFNIGTSYIGNANSNRPKMISGIPSSTAPAILRGDDLTSGLGLGGSGVVTLISGGVDYLHVSSGGYTGLNQTSPTSKTHMGGSVAMAYIAKTAAYTATDANYLISCDATSAAFSITLPTAVGITGRVYKIKRINSGANAVTIDTTSSQTIDGAATYSLALQWAVVTVMSDGANWITI
jgi:hypothetical protein